jgi:hypothetical protein
MFSKSVLSTVASFKASLDGLYEPSASSFGAIPNIFFSIVLPLINSDQSLGLYFLFTNNLALLK